MLKVPVKGKNGSPRKRGRSTKVSDDLRRRILFTVVMVLAYRVGAYLPVPGLPFGNLMERYGAGEGMVAAMSALSMFSGGALSRMSFFALGTMPYITAQIIVQMVASVVPELSRAMKDGDVGHRRVMWWCRILTVLIALVNSIAYMYLIGSWGVSLDAGEIPGWISRIMICATMVVGALVVMWIGELITVHGVGNGMSLLIGVNILSGIPSALVSSLHSSGWWVVGMVLAVTCITIPVIVLVERGQRRVPITYSKQVRGNSIIGGGHTYLPIRVNMAGVIPIIFASTLLAVPAQMAVFFPDVAWVQHVSVLMQTGWFNWLLTAVLVVFFSYFYTQVVFDANDTADQLKRSGGFVEGFRPGEATARYLRGIVDALTLPGAIFMAALAVIPAIAYAFSGASIVNTFGGTSTLIMVGVVLDTMAAVESRMLDYDGSVFG